MSWTKLPRSARQSGWSYSVTKHPRKSRRPPRAERDTAPPWTMPNLISMSFEGDLSPSFDLRCLAPGRPAPDGWGIGFYPGTEPSVSVFKEPAPATGSARSTLVQMWDRVSSSIFVLQFRAARWGSISDANTQPFVRTHGRRAWLFAQAGSLDQRIDPGD